MRRIPIAVFLGLIVAACSSSEGGENPGGTVAAVGPTTAQSASEMPVSSTLPPSTTSTEADADIARECVDGDASVRVRLTGPDVFEGESESVLLVSTPDGAPVCQPVAAPVASRRSGRLTSEVMPVDVVAGTYVFDVGQRSCVPTTGCVSDDSASTDDTVATSADSEAPDTSCETTVVLDGNQPLDIVAEYGPDGCVHVRHVDPDGGNDGPVIYAAPSRIGETAEAIGSVELIEECLWLGNESGDPATFPLIVWRAGTTWDAQDERVVLPDGRSVTPGQQIESAGGFHSIGDLATFASDPLATTKATECLGADSATAGDADTSDSVYITQHPVDS
ncbi:hypothetical protein [Ilumatobacter nonamiensis]|uniref:hypothetical protein n=1 Tax=Ilumatobacter nonamiensis TaxID=467093 RepID=UPI00034D6733|nr:hypothetical protein [Ilumatobacter nonamiensis]